MIQLRSAARGRLQLGRGARLACHRLLGLVGAALLVPACAASPAPETKILHGGSGPVTWEVTDIGQLLSDSGQHMRWSYTIVLKETTGSTVEFERLERGSYTKGIEQIGGTPVSRPFRRTLPSNGELRYSTWETWGWDTRGGSSRAFGGAATIHPLTIEYRFIGKAGVDRSVGVLVRLQLDRSFGKVVTPLPTKGPLPPASVVAAGDLTPFAGSWRGSYRADQGEFDIPLQVVIAPNGSFEAGRTTRSPADPVGRSRFERAGSHARGVETPGRSRYTKVRVSAS
jgi:hypothetical protein